MRDLLPIAGKLGAILLQFPPWFPIGRANKQYILDCAQRVAPDTRVVYVDNDQSKSCCVHTRSSVGRVPPHHPTRGTVPAVRGTSPPF